ncbi:MAG: phosphatidate cytidylyltransferase [Bacteroidetes bacterium]|nr:phosphatidate cytidylyltransferase [Bacteroidota bacterium]
MKNLIVRTISGIVLVVILIFGVSYSPLTRIIVLSAVGIGSVAELTHLIKKSGVPSLNWFTILTAILILGSQVVNVIAKSEVISLLHVISLLSLLLILRCFLELYRKKENPFNSIANEFFAIIYTVIPIFLLNIVNDYRIVLILFFVVWANDVGAYLVGVTFGKHKLFERISPKKSWEGFFGGLLFAIATASISGHIFFQHSPYIWGVIGLLVGLAGVVGDLVESMYKRSINIKDSGNIIPGHGGFLDRFDAMFFAIPIYFFTLHLLKLL